jgi:P-type Ca2+ transporter type 2C
MQRPPRLSSARLFDYQVLKHGLLQGTLLLVVVLAIFGFTLYRGLEANEARALTFTTLVLASIGLIFTNRSWTKSALATLQSPNPALWWVTSSALAILALVLFLPALGTLFSFSKLHGDDVILCSLIGLVLFGLFEILKRFRTSRL